MSGFQHYFLEHEATFRLSGFIILILVFMLFELVWPRHISDKKYKYRRINNILLLVINSLATRLFVPLATYQVATIAAERNYGLFNLVSLPLLLNIVITIIVFDFLIYLQHIVFHKLNILWKIHRVHHTDLDFDVTTGIRFHPFEIVLSMFYKLAAVYLLGPAAFAIILYEILLNAAALFTHSNILLNSRLDTLLRKVFVTPDMHRIHHSVLKFETDSNYGNIFSFWDKLFSTYRPIPEAGYDGMVIGLNEFRDVADGQLIQLLKTPFMKSR